MDGKEATRPGQPGLGPTTSAICVLRFRVVDRVDTLTGGGALMANLNPDQA